MKKRIETSRYIITIRNNYSSFSKANYIDAIETIKKLKALPSEVDGRATESVQQQIAAHRRLIKKDWPRVYRIDIYFKQYNYKTSFDIDYVFSAKAKMYKSSAPKYTRLTKAILDGVHSTLGYYRKTMLQNRPDKKYILKEYETEVFGSRFGKSIVYSKPGQIHSICLKRKVKELYLEKVPEKNNRYVGLELEFCAPIKELDFAIKLWKAGVHKYAQIKKDGSLRPKFNEFGYELAFLFPENHYKKYLRQVCKILKEVGARADDRRCGLHVHLDMRRRKKDIVYNNLVACQNILFKFLDPARRDNEFCRTVESRNFPKKFTNEREERYKTINAASYYKYKTLEVRMHEGSVNYNEIANWMALLIKISNHKIRIKSDINELTILKKRFRIDNRMNEFFQDKTCFWQLQGPARPVQRTVGVASDPLRVALRDDGIPF